MLIFSVFLEFIVGDVVFLWGGVFGEVVSEWLISFVGIVGMIILLIFLLVGVLVWNVNLNFNEMMFQGVVKDMQQYINDWFSGRFFGKKNIIGSSGLY